MEATQHAVCNRIRLLLTKIEHDRSTVGEGEAEALYLAIGHLAANQPQEAEEVLNDLARPDFPRDIAQKPPAAPTTIENLRGEINKFC
jgi:hypothetical protein